MLGLEKTVGFSLSGQEIVELARLYAVLGSVSLSGNRDLWVWVRSEDGNFSVGAVKRLMEADIEVSGSFFMDWCKWIPATCNIFVWRAQMDRFPTTAALTRRGIILEDSNCPFCSESEETVDLIWQHGVGHLFTACRFSVVIWQHGVRHLICSPFRLKTYWSSRFTRAYRTKRKRSCMV
ncbi:putative reverse transcriptase zinc-binding domain-containing protein [Helianthus annuus]|nr:putative reverse transcriptase zinc-binding domain-containing protein [Helianthus annuus]